MPGTNTRARCPKGERRNAKTKQCVKLGRVKTPSPKKSPPKNTRKASSSTKSPPKNTRKTSSPKKASPISIYIPYISSMKDLTSYDKRYMKQLLVRLSNILEGKSLDKDGHPYIYANLHELLEIIQKEIHSITTTQHSGDFVFTSKNVKLIVPHLEQLMTYFKQIANKKGHVRSKLIDELYEN